MPLTFVGEHQAMDQAYMQLGFAAVLVAITVAYAVVAFRGCKWKAYAPRNATLEDAERDLRARSRQRLMRHANAHLSQIGDDLDSPLHRRPTAQEDAALRRSQEDRLPLRIARSRVAMHAPILPSTQAAEHRFQQQVVASSASGLRPAIDDSAPSPFDLTPAQVVASGATRDLPASVALPLLTSPRAHNRWRAQRSLLASVSVVDTVESPVRPAARPPPRTAPEGRMTISVEELQRLAIEDLSTAQPARVTLDRAPSGCSDPSPFPSISSVLRRFTGGGAASLREESSMIVPLVGIDDAMSPILPQGQHDLSEL
jgi:hypothetical protein